MGNSEGVKHVQNVGHKIEALYFLPNAWLNRAIAAQRDKKKVERWWGRKDWPTLKTTPPVERVRMFAERFKKELGYWSVEPWRIFKDNSRNVYYMIHATDHQAAPYLLQRAYRKAIAPESLKEVQLDIERHNPGLFSAQI